MLAASHCQDQVGSQSDDRSSAEVHCRSPDAGCRNLFPICTPCVSSRGFRCQEAKTENRRTCFFCHGTASVESAANRVETVNRQHCSSASLKHFCSPHHTACLKTTFKLCYAPSVKRTRASLHIGQQLVVISTGPLLCFQLPAM